VAEPPAAASLAALVDRALDPDAAVAESASGALAARRRDPAIRQGTDKLRRALLSGLSTRAMRAASALGALRDVEAIPLLIQVLEMSEPATAQAAADALAAITLQRLGPDARKWLTWWKQNRGRGRAEWLFSGLTSPDRETRVAASVELSTAAPPPVAYTADLPAPEREKAARVWAGWWARSGHVL
jgi:HEAT repeat protein